MGYRYYTAHEYAKLNVADKRRRERNAGFAYKYPVQQELAAVMHLIPQEKKGFAGFMTYAKNLSVKQIAAAQHMVDATRMVT